MLAAGYLFFFCCRLSTPIFVPPPVVRGFRDACVWTTRWSCIDLEASHRGMKIRTFCLAWIPKNSVAKKVTCHTPNINYERNPGWKNGMDMIWMDKDWYSCVFFVPALKQSSEKQMCYETKKMHQWNLSQKFSGWKLPHEIHEAVEVVEKWSGWSGQYGIPGRPMKKWHNGHGNIYDVNSEKKNNRNRHIFREYMWIWCPWRMLIFLWSWLKIRKKLQSFLKIWIPTPWSWKFPKLLMGVGTLTHPQQKSPPKKIIGAKNHTYMCVVFEQIYFILFFFFRKQEMSKTGESAKLFAFCFWGGCFFQGIFAHKDP